MEYGVEAQVPWDRGRWKLWGDHGGFLNAHTAIGIWCSARDLSGVRSAATHHPAEMPDPTPAPPQASWLP